jgi:seryl-tRNA synthetase
MIDVKLIRKNPELIKKNLQKRNDPEVLRLLEEFIENDESWRRAQTKVNELRRRRNKISQLIGQLKKQNQDTAAALREAEKIQEMVKEGNIEVREYEGKSRSTLMRIPNLLHESVPYGEDETENVEIRRWGNPPEFDFTPKNHLDIALDLGLIDEARSSKVAGTGFYYLKEDLALLDLAIQRFAIDFLRKRGYVLIEKPYEGVVDLADFETVMYKVENEDLYLIATSEHPLAAMFMDETLLKDDLPIKLTGMSTNFRKEIGTHGKYTKGLFRVHQFNKIEQFIFCLPEQSWKLHEELQWNCEQLYQQLGLHYRVVNVCTGDIGTVPAKKYDVEVWMADGKFRETGSNSNCTDYQARRLNTKYREGTGKPPKDFVHTLNSTALTVPHVLRSYMDGIEVLER